MEQHDVVVVGAGQAGLAASHHLAARGIEHVVLEAGEIGESWQSRRWDSFTLVTPNWANRLPGFCYRPDQPDVFLPRAEIVAMLRAFAAGLAAPIRTGVRVDSLERASGGPGFRLGTSVGPVAARAVVVAAGFLARPNLPSFARLLPGRIRQLSSSEYRSPEALPAGAVLVVGSAQSGCQIAEELNDRGRRVYLSVGSAGRVPRRYRGLDVIRWLEMAGRFDLPEDRWPDPRGRFAPNPHVSGTRGGHTLNLHRFCRDGIRLLGRVEGVDGERLLLAPDLHQQLARVDAFADTFLKQVDEVVATHGLDVPPADLDDPANWDEYPGDDGYRAPIEQTLDLAAAGISTVVWAGGFRPDLGWIRLPALDATGCPVHRAGITAEPGLAFVGIKFQTRNASDLLLGVGDDARFVVDQVAGLLGARSGAGD